MIAIAIDYLTIYQLYVNFNVIFIGQRALIKVTRSSNIISATFQGSSAREVVDTAVSVLRNSLHDVKKLYLFLI